MAEMNRVRGCVWGAAALLVAASCQSPGGEAEEATEALTNSDLTTNYPAVGYVVNEEGGHACTGTLIDSRTVLTAAHCLNEELSDTVINYASKSQIDVYFAADMTSTSGKKRYDAAKLASHPDFGGGNASDIAVVVLDEPVSGVTPIPLHLDAPVVGDAIEILGYGETEFGSVHRRRITNNIIEGVFDEVFRFAPGAGVGTVCFGDSGGPSLLHSDGAWRVAGVHSGTSDPDCGEGNSYDMRVDVFAGFILDNAYETAPEEPGSGDPSPVEPDDVGGCAATSRSNGSLALIGVMLLLFGLRRRDCSKSAA